jgi:hypothetical protein
MQQLFAGAFTFLCNSFNDTHSTLQLWAFGGGGTGEYPNVTYYRVHMVKEGVKGVTVA